MGSCLFRCLLCCPLDGETQIWLGICVLPCVFGGVFFSFMICHAACDHLRPCRSFLFNSFFSCKDRASERDRPYRRKKNSVRGHAKVRTHTVHEETLLHQFFLPKCYFCLQFARKKNLEVLDTEQEATCQDAAKKECSVGCVDDRGPISKACNRRASRLGEACWPRPRVGRKTCWHRAETRSNVET